MSLTSTNVQNGLANVSSENAQEDGKITNGPEGDGIPQKAKNDANGHGGPREPTKVLNLGVFGKIPLHTLSEFYITTHDDVLLTLHQTKTARTLGGWVYDGASCLAKFLEREVLPLQGETYPKQGCMHGQTVVELGAGTGVVGVLAAYHGADTIITDLQNLMPLIKYNIHSNESLLRGSARGETLCWGDDVAHCKPHGNPPDWLILANCVYYDPSFQVLHQTMLDLTTTETKILVCYEERSSGISLLIGRWHDVVRDDFDIIPISSEQFAEGYPDFVRLFWMKRKRE